MSILKFTVEGDKVIVENESIFKDGVDYVKFALDRRLKKKATYLFKYSWNTGRRKIEFNKFFIPELYFSIQRWMMMNPKISVLGTRGLSLNEFLVELDKMSDGVLSGTGKVEIKEKRVDDSVYYNMKFKPFDYQKPSIGKYFGLKKAYDLRGMVLEGEIGSGKTLTSLFINEIVGSDVTVIVCPNNTYDNVWLNTLNIAYQKKQGVYEIKSDKPYKGERFIVSHYEGLAKLNKLNIKGSVTFIVDESHNFAKDTSDRTDLLCSIVDKLNIDDVILLSGTPIKDNYKEIETILKLIDPNFTGRLRNAYSKAYKGGMSVSSQVARVRYSHLRLIMLMGESYKPALVEEVIPIQLKDSKKYLLTSIRKEMRDYFKKRSKELKPLLPLAKQFYFDKRDDKIQEALNKRLTTKKDVNLYKDFIDVIIYDYEHRGSIMHLSDELKYCNRFERTILEPLMEMKDRVNFREAKTLTKYPALKIMGEALGTIVTGRRIECFIDIAREANLKPLFSNRKTIIFSKYIKVADEVGKRYKGITVAHSGTTKNIDSLIHKFEKSHDVAIATTYKSLSTGIHMANSCDRIIMIDRPFKMYEKKQAIGRVRRNGQQTKTIFSYEFELDTGEEPNISSRDGELNFLNAQAVEFITGKKIIIEENKDSKEDKVDDGLKSTLTDTSVIDVKKSMSIFDSVLDRLKRF